MHSGIDFKTLHLFKHLKAYLERDPLLASYYEFDAFDFDLKEVLQNFKFDASTRSLLVQELKAQYQSIERPYQKVLYNIECLEQENTFTVTTGQQIVLFGGPLYVIYKALHTLLLAEQLQQQYPEYNLIPIFWMATEDHDFEEINHWNFQNKTYTWHLDAPKTAVGNVSINADFETLCTAFEAELPSELQEQWKHLKKCYTATSNLTDGFRTLLHEWFGAYGLVLLDANLPSFKKIFQPIMKADILNQESWNTLEQTAHELKSLGVTPKAHHRFINHFYLVPEGRFRIEQLPNKIFKTVDFDKTWTFSELESEMEQFPERFSPNVLLRPLYQQSILPNLVYIGGGAEVLYWLQLKSTFYHYKVFYPVLKLRTSVLLLPKKQFDFLQTHALPLQTVLNASNEHQEVLNILVPKAPLQNDLEQSLQEFLSPLVATWEEKTKALDVTLIPHLKALQKRQEEQWKHYQHKLYKAQQRKEHHLIKKYHQVVEVVFPNKILQERYVYGLEYQLKNPNFVHQLYQHLKACSLDQFNIFVGL